MKRLIDRIFIGRAVDNALEGVDGNKNSGNWGHKGRPGLRGGSGKGGGSHYQGSKFKHASGKDLSDIMYKKIPTLRCMLTSGKTPGRLTAELHG